MGHLRNIIILALMLTFVASCSSKTGEVEVAGESINGFALVNAVELTETEDGGKIAITATKELKYNVFKLTDPDRILIDLIDAHISDKISDLIAGQGGIVSEIKVQAIRDSISTLVRLEVHVSRPSNYLASLEGNTLVVRVFPTGAEMPQDEMSTEDLDLIPPLPMPDEDLSADAAPLEDIPSLEDPIEDGMTDVSALTDTNPPSLEAPSVDLVPPTPLVEEAAPEVPSISEVPTPEGPEMKASSTVEAPVPPAVPDAGSEITAPVPVPLVDEPVAEKTEQPNKVIVEPEDIPVPSIITQEVPTTELTEGASLLSGIGNRVYTGKRVSLEFQDAQIQDVLRLIAEVSKLNIIISDDVKGTITLKLIDVPWDQALDIILTSKGLDKMQHGNILRVAPIESLKKEREIALANDKAAKQLEPLRLKLFNVNYATAGEMASRIKNLLSERGSVDTDERTNTLIVEDIAENLSRIENLINVLDTQTPQVRIESRIVQANDTFSRSLGIQWGPTLRLDDVNDKQTDFQFPRRINVGTAPKSGIGFTAPLPGKLSEYAVDALPGSTGSGSIGFRLGSVNDIFNLDLRLSYAENQQLARIVSRPSVTVLDNRTARIIQGTKIPFLSSSSDGSNVQFQEAGIEINVTPQITNDGSVILKVATKSNEAVSENVGGNPILSIREASTEMLVKSGRTAVLGGVFKTTEREGKAGVPGLMNIPVLGWLFKGQQKSNEREEMLIFITPYILTDTRDAISAPSSTSQLNP